MAIGFLLDAHKCTNWWGGIVNPILFKCPLQQIRHQQTTKKVAFQVLIALRHPSHSPSYEVMHIWLSVILKATV